MEYQSPIPLRLKAARARAGLSQKKLGILSGIDEFAASARMNQYEKGTHNPSFQTIASLAEVLNVPTAYFYAIEDDLADLILGYSALDKERKSQLIEFSQEPAEQ